MRLGTEPEKDIWKCPECRCTDNMNQRGCLALFSFTLDLIPPKRQLKEWLD
jgi:hypothetical protein